MALGVQFHESKPATHVYIAHGESVLVEVLEYADVGGTLVEKPLLSARTGAAGGVVAAAADDDDDAAGYHVLGPGDMGAAAREKDAQSSKRSKLMTDLDEPTIAERLERLSSALAASGAEMKSGGKSVPTSDSLVVVLSQALQSMDDQLLEQCLNTNEPKVVEATVERLSPDRVVPFLLR